MAQPSLVVASLDKMLHDDYLCLVESGKQQIKEVRRKFNLKTWKQRQLLSESGFVLRIASPPLSRDRRHQSCNRIFWLKVLKAFERPRKNPIVQIFFFEF